MRRRDVLVMARPVLGRAIVLLLPLLIAACKAGGGSGPGY